MMILLAAGVLVFVGIHALPSFPAARLALIERLGEGPYKGMFSLVALTGVVLIVVGKAYADFVPVWQPPVWGRHFTVIVMLPVFVLLAGANMRGNLKRFTRHPMLWGIALWSVGHLLANGDLASLILFGGFGLFALVDMWSANQRGAAKSNEKRPFKSDVIVVAAGTLAYVVLLFLHPYLFRVPAI